MGLKIETKDKRQMIGTRMTAEREHSGKTIANIVKETGLSKQQVLSIETGEASYTVDSLIAYAEVLGIEILEPQTRKEEDNEIFN